MVDRIGPYRVVGELGRGGMGVVYDARSPEGRPVAVKVLLDADPELRARFQTEIQACAALEHPNVVRLLDAGVGAYPYLVMERLEGETLEDRLKRGPLPPLAAVSLVGSLASALHAVHERGIVHRDLKPSNVFLCSERAVITDFGLARDPGRERERLTATGQMLGTPGYMAPEQINGDKDAFGPATDVYGLGVVLYECLTGARPFVGGGLQVLQQVLEAPPTPPSQVLDLDPALEAIVLRCLEKRPADRFGSAAELSAALDDFALAGSARTAGGAGAGLLVAGGATVLLIGAVIAWRGFAADPPRPPSETASSPAPNSSPASPTVSAPTASPAPERHTPASRAAIEQALRARDRGEARRLLDRVPTDAWTVDDWVLSGRVLRAEADVAYDFGLREEARAHLQRATRLDPRHLEAVQRLALLSVAHGREYARLVQRAQALASRPTGLGLALEGQAQLRNLLRSPVPDRQVLRGAVDTLVRATKLEPDCDAVWFCLFDALAKASSHLGAEGAGRLTRAIERADERRRSLPAITWVSAGAAMTNYAEGAHAALAVAAIRRFDQALSLEPACGLAYLERGYTRLFRLKERVEGLRDFDEVRRLGRANAHMRFTLAIALRRLDLPCAAALEASEAVRLVEAQAGADRGLLPLYRRQRADLRALVGEASDAADDYAWLAARGARNARRAARDQRALAEILGAVREQLRQRQWKDALASLDGIPAAEVRGGVAAQVLRGRVLSERFIYMGDPADKAAAVRAFQAAVAIAPDHLEAHVRWALVDLAHARRAESAALGRTGPWAALAVGVDVSAQQGRARAAGELERLHRKLLEVVDQAAGYPEMVHLRLGLELTLLGRKEAAARAGWAGRVGRTTELARRAFPDDPRIVALVAFAYQVAPRQLRLAETTFTRALALEPRFAGAWAQRAAVRWKLKDRKGALADLQRAIKIDPRKRNWHQLRIRIFRELGDDEAARRAEREMRAAFPPRRR